jgi:hypothetical protein
MACVNYGVHFVSVPPSIGRRLFAKKLKHRFLPDSGPPARRVETPGA